MDQRSSYLVLPVFHIEMNTSCQIYSTLTETQCTIVTTSRYAIPSPPKSQSVSMAAVSSCAAAVDACPWHQLSQSRKNACWILTLPS